MKPENMQKGLTIEPDIIYWETVDPSRPTLKAFIGVSAFELDANNNAVSAWGTHPTYGGEKYTRQESRISNATPIRVVLRSKYDEDVAALTATIQGLTDRLSALEAYIAERRAAAAAAVTKK